MLESLMLIALGFLTATLFGLIAVQLTWRRAVKVTTHKLTDDLDLDALKLQADKAALLDVNLQDKHEEVQTLLAKNAELEDTLENVRGNATQLSQDIATLHTLHRAAQAEAETHLQNVTLLQSRIADLETSARGEIEKRGLVETQLKTLGDRASRLIADMSAVASQIGATQELLTSEHAPQLIQDVADIIHAEPAAAPTPTAPVAVAPVMLTPFEDDDVLISDDMSDLAEIKASLSSLSEGGLGEGGPMPEDGDEPLTATEGYIADRIRALKDGVASPA